MSNATLTDPGQEQMALGALQNGQSYRRASNQDEAFKNFCSAVEAYLKAAMNPETAAPGQVKVGQGLVQQLSFYQESEATPELAMAHFLGFWSTDRMAQTSLKAASSQNPEVQAMAGPMANVVSLASDSARYGAPAAL